MRDPLKQIRAWNVHTGDRSSRRIKKVVGHLGNREGDFHDAPTSMDRDLVFNHLWNKRIEDEIYGRKNFGGCYRVEDVDADLVEKMCWFTGNKSDPTLIAEKLNTVPRDTNSGEFGRRGVDWLERQGFSWEDFTEGPYLEACKERARKHGYL